MKKILVLLIGLFYFASQAFAVDQHLPPVPEWQPDFSASTSDILERMKYYSNNEKDIVIFKNGTAVVLPDDMKDKEAKEYAMNMLSEIFNHNPDMKPIYMDDGNILIKYNQPVFNVVINDFANKHLKEIKKNHLNALARGEILFTPLGKNKFDDFGMKALYGRTFMFMDAQSPAIETIYRHKNEQNTLLKRDTDNIKRVHSSLVIKTGGV